MPDKRIIVLKMIAEDAKKDVEYYDGQPFTGRNVAQYFGKQGAAIAALAKIMETILSDKEGGK